MGAASSKDRSRSKKKRPRLVKGALVVEHDARLPSVCLKCGAVDGVTKRPTTFYWIPMWTRALVFCGVGLVLMLLLREESALGVPLCPSCLARWNAARNARRAALVVAVGVILGLRFWLRPPREMILLGTVLALAGGALVYVATRSRLLGVRRIEIVNDVHFVHFTGFDAAAAEQMIGPQVTEGARD